MLFMQLTEGMRFLSGKIRNFLGDEEGVGVVEIILILLVLVGLVILFRSQISTIAKNIFSSINSSVSTASQEIS